MPSTQLLLVSPEQVETLWPFVGDRAESAVKRASLMDETFVKNHLLSAAWQLWLVCVPGEIPDIRALAITTMDELPRGRVCTLMVCTGEDMGLWLHHLAEIETWARDVWRCRRITAWARPGWERVLKDYRKTHVILDKELADE
jgi:hypothetical protein